MNDKDEDAMNRKLCTQINLPIVDLSGQTQRHVFVARGSEIDWNGHPSTVLMPDGRTIFCVWQARRDGTPQHGAPAGYMKRSDDGGLTWSDYLNLPANWREIGRGSPTAPSSPPPTSNTSPATNSSPSSASVFGWMSC
jgi:hypothetical protein